MTWTELIAFWVTFALTFLGFISWFNLGDRTRKLQSTAKLSHRWKHHRKEMAEAKSEERIDELAHRHAKTPDDAQIKAEIAERGKFRGNEH